MKPCLYALSQTDHIWSLDFTHWPHKRARMHTDSCIWGKLFSMKRWVSFLFILFNSSDKLPALWIYFTDKQNTSEYLLSGGASFSFCTCTHPHRLTPGQRSSTHWTDSMKGLMIFAPEDADKFYWIALSLMTWCNVTGKCGIRTETRNVFVIQMRCLSVLSRMSGVI